MQEEALIHCFYECKFELLLWKSVGRVIQKSSNRPYGLDTLLYCIAQKYMYIHFYCRIIHSARKWYQAECPSREEWIQKNVVQWVVVATTVGITVALGGKAGKDGGKAKAKLISCS